MATVIGLGELLWDIFPDGRLAGGAPANVAFHAKQLGHQASVASRVGDDPEGRELVAVLGSHGMGTDLIQVDPVHPTGSVEVQVAPDGSPAYIQKPDVAFDYLAEPHGLRNRLAAADAVCFGTFGQRHAVSRQTILSLLPACKRLTLFDLNLRHDFWSRELVEQCLAMANVVKLAESEWSRLLQSGLGAGITDPVDWCRTRMDAFGIDLFAMTRGSRGCLLVTAEQRIDLPGEPVEIVDTVGCGDAFSAALVHGLLAGAPLARVAEFANRVGAFLATRRGATPTLPDYLRKSGLD